MENHIRSNGEPCMKDIYEITREHITHEDNLVNNRLTWFLVVQSLLFAAYGVVLDALQQDNSNTTYILRFKSMIPWVGAITSVLAFTSVLGARLACSEMQKFWHGKKKNKTNLFPPIVCGTCPKWLGSIEAYTLPFLFIIAWIYVSIGWCA